MQNNCLYVISSVLFLLWETLGQTFSKVKLVIISVDAHFQSKNPSVSRFSFKFRLTEFYYLNVVNLDRLVFGRGIYIRLTDQATSFDFQCFFSQSKITFQTYRLHLLHQGLQENLSFWRACVLSKFLVFCLASETLQCKKASKWKHLFDFQAHPPKVTVGIVRSKRQNKNCYFQHGCPVQCFAPCIFEHVPQMQNILFYFLSFH